MTATVATSGDALEGALRRGLAYVERERLRGYDPYDALASPLFRLPGLRSSHAVRFGAQQLLKRLPVNVRPLLGIAKGYNPVTVALVAQARAYLARAEPERADEHAESALWCVRELARLRSPGYSGDCWGYDFDWAARRVSIPAGTPTIVATGFVTNALFVVWSMLRDEAARALCEGAVAFVLGDLNRTTDERGRFCWSYSPLDREVVLNATLKGSRLCAQVHSLVGGEDLRDAALGSAAFVVAAQRPDGSWPYSLGDERRWVDHYHTAYVLDCLDEIGELTGDPSLAEPLAAGRAFYRHELFHPGDVPKFRTDRGYPIDATCCGQALLTLCRLGELDAAERCARWSVARLGLPDGGFAYQVHGRYTNRIPYMRWSTAWMLAGLARVRLALAERS